MLPHISSWGKLRTPRDCQRLARAMVLSARGLLLIGRHPRACSSVKSRRRGSRCRRSVRCASCKGRHKARNCQCHRRRFSFRDRRRRETVHAWRGSVDEQGDGPQCPARFMAQGDGRQGWDWCSSCASRRSARKRRRRQWASSLKRRRAMSCSSFKSRRKDIKRQRSAGCASCKSRRKARICQCHWRRSSLGNRRKGENVNGQGDGHQGLVRFM